MHAHNLPKTFTEFKDWPNEHLSNSISFRTFRTDFLSNFQNRMDDRCCRAASRSLKMTIFITCMRTECVQTQKRSNYCKIYNNEKSHRCPHQRMTDSSMPNSVVRHQNLREGNQNQPPFAQNNGLQNLYSKLEIHIHFHFYYTLS